MARELPGWPVCYLFACGELAVVRRWRRLLCFRFWLCLILDARGLRLGEKWGHTDAFCFDSEGLVRKLLVTLVDAILPSIALPSAVGRPQEGFCSVESVVQESVLLVESKNDQVVNILYPLGKYAERRIKLAHRLG